MSKLIGAKEKLVNLADSGMPSQVGLLRAS